MKIIEKPIDDLRYWSKKTNITDPKQYKLSYYNIFVNDEKNGILYNTFSNALAILEMGEVSLYKYYCRINYLDDSTLSKQLIENGFAVHMAIDETKYMLEETRSALYLRDRWKQFTILPTQKCNANCFYCFEKDVKRICMSKSIADDVAEFIIENTLDVDTFNLDWFGGEPLLEYDLICYMINELRNKSYKRFTSSITTNGLLFSKERVLEAVHNWNLTRASITIDGLHDEHNRRKNVGKNVDAFTTTLNNIALLLDNNVYVNLRVHIDKYNVNQLEDILSYLKPYSKNKLFHLFVEKLFMPLQVKRHEDQFRYIKPEESIPFYTEMMILMKKYGFVKSYSSFLSSRRETSCIGSRRDTVIINSDGNLYNCEQEFYDINNNIGSIYSGVAYNDRYFYMINGKIEGTECEKCIYLPDCVGGCWFTKAVRPHEHLHCMRGRILTPIAMKLLLDELRI